MSDRRFGMFVLATMFCVVTAPSYSAPPAAVVINEVTPLWSKEFIDTIGVNMHLSFANTLDYNSTQSVLSGLNTLGIRHIRQVVAPTVRGRIAEAASLGMKFDVPLDHCITGLPKGSPGAPGYNPGRNSDGYAGDDYYSPASWMRSLDATVGLSHVDAIEECNEPNGPANGGYDRFWQTDVPLQVESFYKTAISRNIPFIAPAFAMNDITATFATPAPRGARINFAEQNGIAYQHLNSEVDISSRVSFQNLHIYTVRWPGFSKAGRELNAASVIDSYNNAVNPTVNGAKRKYWVTETGWSHDAHDGTWVPLNILARWIPILFLDNYDLDIRRTYLFNDIDATPYLGAGFTHYGLLTYTVGGNRQPGGSPNEGASPTLEFMALENFINILNDPATSYAPSPISFAITGGDQSLRSRVFQKSNGLYLLALWKNEEDYVPSSSPLRQPEPAIRPENITVVVANPVSSRISAGVASTFDDAGGFSNKAAAVRDCGANVCFDLAVTTNLTVLQLAPSGFSAQTPVPSPTPFGSSTPAMIVLPALIPTPGPGRSER